KAIVTTDGELHGFVGGGCVQAAVRRAAQEAMAEGQPRLIRVKPKDDVVESVDADGVELHKSSCPSGGTVELFLEPMRQDMHLVVCGASPVAAVLAKLARSMGFHTVSAALPGDRGKVETADDQFDGFDLSSLEISVRDAVVVATQGKRDREALKAALLSPAGYVGMVGSRTKIATLLEQLGSEIPSTRKAVLHGPAGLDIGAIDPEEIALSILAEIVQERRRSVRASPALAAEADENVT
ncbi:MAG: XdhC family protein, partial [Methyloligellaceae bacterium]